MVDLLDEALAQTATWPAANVSAAVVAPDGPIATVGDLDHRFALASVTKPLAALGCLIAVEEGTLDLDEPAVPDEARDVTVRHLLAHAGGYGFDTGLLQPPGRTRIYSNTGFDALANHLTARAGIPATEYVTEAVFVALDMRSTDLRLDSLAYGATSTVSDMIRTAQELMRPTLVHTETLHSARSVQFPGLDGVLPGFGRQTPNDWGLGFEIRGHKSPHWTGSANAPSTFGHFGAAGTFIWVDPNLDHALVVLTDEPFGPWARHRWPELNDAVVSALS
ncbi:MAG: beta-lactamase family protein [Microthrixaceae bacterium]|nr:beta-lactamase family protein [Microthrixaceae bacterium]